MAANALRPAITKAERDDFIEECLQGEGSAAFERKTTGGFAGENVSPFDETAMATCVEESFERWPNSSAPSSFAEHAVLYELYLVQANCLRGLEFEIDTPSLDSYVDGGGFWVPYDGLPPPSNLADWAAVNEACPQDPWLYEDGS